MPHRHKGGFRWKKIGGFDFFGRGVVRRRRRRRRPTMKLFPINLGARLKEELCFFESLRSPTLEEKKPLLEFISLRKRGDRKQGLMKALSF